MLHVIHLLHILYSIYYYFASKSTKICTRRSENWWKLLISIIFSFTFVGLCLQIVNNLHFSLDLRKTWSCPFSKKSVICSWTKSIVNCWNNRFEIRWSVINSLAILHLSHHSPESRIFQVRIQNKTHNAYFCEWNSRRSYFASIILRKTFLESRNIDISKIFEFIGGRIVQFRSPGFLNDNFEVNYNLNKNCLELPYFMI